MCLVYDLHNKYNQSANAPYGPDFRGTNINSYYYKIHHVHKRTQQYSIHNCNDFKYIFCNFWQQFWYAILVKYWKIYTLY